MKQKLSGFLQIMYDLNPDAVGGAMPGDDFYYIPANNGETRPIPQKVCPLGGIGLVSWGVLPPSAYFLPAAAKSMQKTPLKPTV